MQYLCIDAGEAAGLQRVQRQHAPGFVVDIQRCTETIVHRQMRAAAVDETVIGIGQCGVVETHRLTAEQDARQTRLVGHNKTPAQCVLAESADRQRLQRRPLQLQQCDRVTAELAAQHGEQALVTHLRRQRLGEVGDDIDDRLGDLMRGRRCCHINLM